MLKLDVNREKQLTFEVQIGGVQSDKISSHLRIKIDEIIDYIIPLDIIDFLMGKGSDLVMLNGDEVCCSEDKILLNATGTVSHTRHKILHKS